VQTLQGEKAPSTIEIAGDFKGTTGKFKFRSSFPVVLPQCDHLIDKSKINKVPVYVVLHGDRDGKPNITYLPIEEKRIAFNEYYRDQQ